MEQVFSNLQNHSMFILRERVYRGGNQYGSGLAGPHEVLKQILETVSSIQIPSIYFEINNSSFMEISTKLKESLDMIPLIAGSNRDKEEILKFIQITEIEMNDLREYIDEGLKFSPDQIVEEPNRVEELKGKIEDNFFQLSRQYGKEHFKDEIVQDESALVEWQLLNHGLELSLQIEEEGYLTALAFIATKMRDDILQYPVRLSDYLRLYVTVTSTFIAGIQAQNLEKAERLRQNIERYINTKRLYWLGKLHGSIYEEYPSTQVDDRFTQTLDKLAKDPKEEFLWTMSSLAREKHDVQLEKVSVDFANLATILLTADQELRDRGLTDIADAVRSAEEIKALDAIDDIDELYHPENIDTSQLIKAISTQLENLKELASQIILLDDLKSTLQMIIEFTDFNASFETGQTVEEYLQSLGVA